MSSTDGWILIPLNPATIIRVFSTVVKGGIRWMLLVTMHWSLKLTKQNEQTKGDLRPPTSTHLTLAMATLERSHLCFLGFSLPPCCDQGFPCAKCHTDLVCSVQRESQDVHCGFTPIV